MFLRRAKPEQYSIDEPLETDEGEIVTGLLFIDKDSRDFHAQQGTVREPLTQVPFERLNPGNAELQKLQEQLR